MENHTVRMARCQRGVEAREWCSAAPFRKTHPSPIIVAVSTLRRYILYQVPGWIAAALLTGAVAVGLEIDPWIAAAVVAIWIAKDFALYPLVRAAYERPGPDGAYRLVGRLGVVERTDGAEGMVRVRGELWRAETSPGGGPLTRGARVRVVGVDGLLLVVEPADDALPL